MTQRTVLGRDDADAKHDENGESKEDDSDDDAVESHGLGHLGAKGDLGRFLDTDLGAFFGVVHDGHWRVAVVSCDEIRRGTGRGKHTCATLERWSRWKTSVSDES